MDYKHRSGELVKYITITKKSVDFQFVLYGTPAPGSIDSTLGQDQDHDGVQNFRDNYPIVDSDGTT